MGGFADWVETIADSRNGQDYRRRVKDSERLDVAEPRLRAELQGGVLHGGVSGGRRRYQPVSARSRKELLREVIHPLRRKKNRSMSSRLGRRGRTCGSVTRTRRSNELAMACGPGRSSGFYQGASSHISAREGGEAERHLPLHLHRSKETGDRYRHRNGQLQVQDGHQAKSELYLTADSDAARFPRERTEPSVGPAATAYPLPGIARIAESHSGKCFPFGELLSEKTRTWKKKLLLLAGKEAAKRGRGLRRYCEEKLPFNVLMPMKI